MQIQQWFRCEYRNDELRTGAQKNVGKGQGEEEDSGSHCRGEERSSNLTDVKLSRSIIMKREQAEN